MISKEQLEKFKKIYKKEFNKDISDQDALESATSLLNMIKAIYKPIPKDFKNKKTMKLTNKIYAKN